MSVEKLRAIQLMEADFNFTNKLLIGSRMLRQAELHYDLSEENSGSRRGRTYVEVALKSRLIGDRLRLPNRAGCIISADAHTCYNRTVRRFAILVCMSLALPYKPLAIMFKAIAGMYYSVRTGLGVFTTYVSCETGKLFHGGPAVWLLVSLMLVRFVHRPGMVSEVSSSISGVVFLIMGFIFVDVTDLAIFRDENKNLNQVLAWAQAVLNSWAGPSIYRGEHCWRKIVHTHVWFTSASGEYGRKKGISWIA